MTRQRMMTIGTAAAARRALATLLPVVIATTASVARASYHELIDVQLEGQKANWWCWAASGRMIFNYLGRPDIRQCDQVNMELGRSDCCGSQACTSHLDCAPANAIPCAANADCVPPGAPDCASDSDCSGNQFCFGGKCSPNLCRSGVCTMSMCAGTCTPTVCNHGGGTQFAPWSFDAMSTAFGTGLSFADYKAEIDALRPVEFAWSFQCADPDHKGCYKIGSDFVSGGHVLVATGYWIDTLDPTNRMVVIDDPMPVGVGSKYLMAYDDWIYNLSESDGHATQVHVHHIKNKLATDCPPGQTTRGGQCCPLHDACGSACCNAGDPPSNDCGDHLCADLDTCADAAAGVCCGFAEPVCNGACCALGDSCVQGTCCSQDRSCGSVCCPAGQVCSNGQCTQLACRVGQRACVSEGGRVPICCAQNVTCCNGECCPNPSDSCCGPGGSCQDINTCVK